MDFRYNPYMMQLLRFGNTPYSKDKLILVSLLGSLILNIVLWVILISKFGYSQDPLPLHFNVVYGIDFVGTVSQVHQLPASGLVIFFVNWLLSRAIYPTVKLYSYFLTIGTVVIQAILLAGGLSIIYLNS